MNAAVVLPTYNDRESIARLVPEILRTDPRLSVLVVDDDSPDGTGDLVAHLAAADDRVRLARRLGRLGYGTACLRGFREALAAGAELVLCMDAGGTHDPADLPRFLSASESADIVVGSRYTGGASPPDGPRRRLSRAANRYLCRAAGLPLADCTSRFRCYHRRVLEAIELETILSEEHAFVVEVVCRAARRGFRLEEVPISIPERPGSQSWPSAAAALEAALVPWRRRSTLPSRPPMALRTDRRLSP